jgi:hypothetical protein
MFSKPKYKIIYASVHDSSNLEAETLLVVENLGASGDD